MQDLQTFLQYCDNYVRKGNSKFFVGKSKIWHMGSNDYLELPLRGLQDGTYKRVQGCKGTLSCSFMWGNSVGEFIDCINRHYDTSMIYNEMQKDVQKIWVAFFHLVKLIKFNSGCNLCNACIYFAWKPAEVLPFGIMLQSFGVEELQKRGSEGVCPSELTQYLSSLDLTDVLCMSANRLSNHRLRAIAHVEYWGTQNILCIDNIAQHTEINLDTMRYTIWFRGKGVYEGVIQSTNEIGCVNRLLVGYFGIPLVYEKIKIYVNTGRYQLI